MGICLIFEKAALRAWVRAGYGRGRSAMGQGQDRETRREEERLARILFLLFLAVGIGARVWRSGAVPGGINQDEAFAAYEAYSLLTTGLDTSGYPFPVYLTAWGSGMNALESYLMIPFIALFGLETWAIRMPQLIVAILSLAAAYDVMERMADRWAALCGLFLLAVCPWHIFLARWGLESNLAPGFLLFGLCFFLRGLEDHRFFLLSALMYGLSLYCYATIWPFVPLILLLQAGYAWRCGRLRCSGRDGLWVGLSVGVLFLLALPLLLFLLVNLGLLEEVRLPFLSIPRLLYLRSGEFSFSRIPENVRTLLRMLFTQTDGLPWNGTERFGLFYYGTLPFFFLGTYHCVRELAAGLRRGELCPLGFLPIQLGAAVLQGASISSNVNRVNSLWPAVVLLSAVGAWRLCSRIDRRSLIVPLILYAALFVQFEHYYFTDYAREAERYFAAGLEQAVDAAAGREGTICVSPGANYARVLFYSGQDPDEYRATVRYTNYPSAFLDVEGFGRYTFDFDPGAPDRSCVYVLDAGADLETLREAGFTIESYGYYVTAYHG